MHTFIELCVHLQTNESFQIITQSNQLSMTRLEGLILVLQKVHYLESFSLKMKKPTPHPKKNPPIPKKVHISILITNCMS